MRGKKVQCKSLSEKDLRLPDAPLLPPLPGSRHQEDDSRFAQAVSLRLEGGLLRYSKRLELLKLAKRMGIDRQHAALIMADVQYQAGSVSLLLARPPGQTTPMPGVRDGQSELGLKMAALLIGVALVDLILIRAWFS